MRFSHFNGVEKIAIVENSGSHGFSFSAFQIEFVKVKTYANHPYFKI
ncbi:MAG: hypothetical protein MJ081_05840 [Ruminococcus sp.]|nr:hypothetical protein [Ruminococcus sp.]